MNKMSAKILMVSFKNMSVLYSHSRIFVIPVYIFNGRKQTLVDPIGMLSALRMRGLHDKRHLLAKLRICGSENSHYFLIHESFLIHKAFLIHKVFLIPEVLRKFLFLLR